MFSNFCLTLKRVLEKREGGREETYQTQAALKMDAFRKKGYPETLLQECKARVDTIDRATTLTKKVKVTDEEEKLYLITTFRPNGNPVKDVVSKNWDMLDRSKTTKKFFNRKVVKGYKRPKNLRDHLVRSKIRYDENPKPKPIRTTKEKNRCRKFNCKYCKILKKEGSITSHKSGEKFGTKTEVTCKSSNIIYCIECSRCNIQYVGQTKRQMRERIGEHLGYIRRKKWKNDVPVHFNKCDHEGEKDVRVHILDFIYCHPNSDRGKQLRLRIEFNWIHRLKTSSPWGLNTLDSRYG